MWHFGQDTCIQFEYEQQYLIKWQENLQASKELSGMQLPNKRVLFALSIVLFVSACECRHGISEDNAGVESASKRARPVVSPSMIHESLEERKMVIAELINFLKSRDNHKKRQRGTAEQAIRALGKVRAEEAIPVLVNNIAFPHVTYDPDIARDNSSFIQMMLETGRVTEESIREFGIVIPSEDSTGSGEPPMYTDPQGFARFCPAVGALTSIGHLSAAAVIDKLSRTNNSLERQCCIVVLANLQLKGSVVEQIDEAIRRQSGAQQERLRESRQEILKTAASFFEYRNE